MSKVFKIVKILQDKTFKKIVLIIGLFFLLAILSLVFFAITKNSPLITNNGHQSSAQIAGKSDNKSNNQGVVKGISTTTEAVDKSSVNKTNDGEILWQDFIDDRFESNTPSAQLASSSDQSNNPTQSTNPLIDSSNNQLANPPATTSTSSDQQNQQTNKSTDQLINQSTDFSITSFEPKDKSGFTVGDKIIFKVETKDTDSSGLLLYKYTIDVQPISDWTDKNALEWMANGSAPAKHTVTIEVRNSKGDIINKTQDFFLYLKPIGFE